MKMDKLRAGIAAHRRHPALRVAARAAEKYLRAFNNQWNWDIHVNGEAAALRRILAAKIEGDVFDVGANEGQWAAMALATIGSRKLHCFEAVPATFDRLKKRIGERDNVTLNAFGLGAEARQAEFYFYPASSDRTSAFHLDDDFMKERVSVPIRRGDDYGREQGVGQIAFLKIDVEGMEIEVLSGFEESLRAGLVKAIQFEHGPAHILSRHFLRDFVEFLGAFDYRVFRCFPNALVALDYDMSTDETFAGQNFIALHPDARAACDL